MLVRRGIEGDFLPCSLSDIWNEATSMSTSSIDDDIIFVTSGLGGDVSNDSAPWGLRNVLALLAVGGVGRSADDGRVVRIWLMGPGGRNSGKQGTMPISAYEVYSRSNIFILCRRSAYVHLDS